MSRQSWVELLEAATGDGTAVANSTTETIIFPNTNVPGNYLQDGRLVRVRASGRYSTTATPTIRFRARLGGVAGTLIWDSGTITLPTVTAGLWTFEFDIQVRSNGATGTVFTIGTVEVGSAAAPSVGSATGASASGVFGSAGDDTPAAVTVDLTADQALSITATWSAASASNTLTGHQKSVIALN